MKQKMWIVDIFHLLMISRNGSMGKIGPHFRNQCEILRKKWLSNHFGHKKKHSNSWNSVICASLAIQWQSVCQQRNLYSLSIRMPTPRIFLGSFTPSACCVQGHIYLTHFLRLGRKIERNQFGRRQRWWWSHRRELHFIFQSNPQSSSMKRIRL